MLRDQGEHGAEGGGSKVASPSLYKLPLLAERGTLNRAGGGADTLL